MNHPSTLEHRRGWERLTKTWSSREKQRSKTEAEKRVAVIFLTKQYDWPQPTAEFRSLTIKHPEYLVAWFTEQHSRLMRCYREEDVVVVVWVKQPQVTSTPQFYMPMPLQPTHVCLWMCNTALKKQNGMWIYFLLCVGFVPPVTQHLSCSGLSSPWRWLLRCSYFYFR